MMSLLPMILGAGADANQSVNVTIGEDIIVLITPNPLEFGPLVSGTNNNTATNGPISFDATGSNVNVTITVASVTGAPFNAGLKFGGLNPVGQIFNQNCVLVSSVCTYTPVTTVPTLSIPTGSPAGTKTGTITYTITGPTP